MPESSGPTKATILDAVRDLIRWHYYSEKMGGWSPGDGYQGVDRDVLAPLEACLADEVAQLKAEGELWAELCQRLPNDRGPGIWADAKEMLRHGLPEKPNPPPSRGDFPYGKVVKLTLEDVLYDGWSREG